MRENTQHRPTDTRETCGLELDYRDSRDDASAAEQRITAELGDVMVGLAWNGCTWYQPSASPTPTQSIHHSAMCPLCDQQIMLLDGQNRIATDRSGNLVWSGLADRRPSHT